MNPVTRICPVTDAEAARMARPDTLADLAEQITAVAPATAPESAFAPGEVLHGMRVTGHTVAQVLAMLRQRGVSVRWFNYVHRSYARNLRSVPGTWFVYDAVPWAPRQVMLFVGPARTQPNPGPPQPAGPRAPPPCLCPGWLASARRRGGGHGTGRVAAAAAGLMLGHSHALSGGVTGLATGLFLQMSFPQTVALAGFTAGMALLPDLDKCGSSPARCLGFLSEAVAWIIGKVTGGHRHFTHSILGIAAFTTLAWVSCHYRQDWGGKAGLALLMTLTVSGGLEALRVARSHLADLIGIAVASWEVWYGYGLRLIPIAVFVGCCTHIGGDMLTDSGCMLLYPVSRQRYHLLPEPLAFTTGTRPELLIVDPLLTAALFLLTGWAVDPAFVAAHWRAVAG